MRSTLDYNPISTVSEQTAIRNSDKNLNFAWKHDFRPRVYSEIYQVSALSVNWHSNKVNCQLDAIVVHSVID